MNGDGSSLTQRIGAQLKTPFASNMTWLQLAAVVVFISVVLIAWRQVVLMIDAEL